ncbi:MAG: hypothetical protein KIT36_03395 [Alphaproteobacteria bacterium]|nr:hypothetical protein [Alphaproteobacteria bacterium]
MPTRGKAGGQRRRTMVAVATLALGLVTAMAWARPGSAADQKYPDVVAVKVQPRGDNRFDFDVTVSSPYDTPQRYADAFRVVGADGTVYGERLLLHDHAGEQPFTRDLYGVRIPPGIRVVVVQARDRQYGYGGKTVQTNLPGR